MIKLFKLASQRHEEIKKEAVLGALTNLAARGANYGVKAVKSVGAAVANNPMKTLGTTLATASLASDTAQGANMASKSKALGSFFAGPTHGPSF